MESTGGSLVALTCLFSILRSLHDGMHGRVRVDGSLSESFQITIGVRQGCIVGPVLFNLFYAAMLMDVTRDLQVGVYIRFRTSGKLCNLARLRSSTKVLEELIHELLYADDYALEAHSFAGIQEIADRFAASAARYCFSINLAKTKVVFQPAPGTPYSHPKVNIGGTLLKRSQASVIWAAPYAMTSHLIRRSLTASVKPADLSENCMTGYGVNTG